jgi:hypothetical protein
VDQIAIAILGLTAVFMSQSKSKKLNKFACLFGMSSQPFWLYSTYVNGLWGMFVLSIFYSFAWGVGIKNNWFNKGDMV